MKVDINLTTGSGSVGHFMHLLNTPQYLSMRREAFANDSLMPDINSAPDLLSWDTTKYTNWQKKLIGGTASYTNAQVSISGGNKNTQYLVSSNYLENGTVIPGNFSDKRASLNFSLNSISDNEKFRMNLNVNYQNDNSNLPGYDPTPFVIALPPDIPDLQDNKGNPTWPPFVSSNPYANLLEKYKLTGNNLIGNINLTYVLLPDLEILTNASFNRVTLDEIQTYPIEYYNPAYGVTTGNSNFASNSTQNWNIEPQINWRKQTNVGKFNVLVGATFQQNLQQGSGISGYGYTNDNLLENLSSAGFIFSSGTSYDLYKYCAGFARMTYNYNDKYIVNISGRRDGSSRFGPGNQFANFGSLGLAWIFSEENFIKKHLAFLSFGKIRGSYGIAGNDQIQSYIYQQLFGSTNYTFLNQPTLYPENLYNPNYSWEKDKKFEVGLDLGFIKDRILFGANFYKNTTSNQLLGYSLPPSVGYSSVQTNLPAIIQNTGLEMTLNTVNIKSSAFSWSTSINISIPKNKLVAYPGLENSSYANTYTIGKSLYTKKTLHYLEVDPATGIYKYQDIDGSGTGLDYPGDLQASKAIEQTFYGGFLNSFKYKGFQLDFLFQFVDQTGSNPLLTAAFVAPGGESNQISEVLNRWQRPGDNSQVQKFTTGGGTGYLASQTWSYATLFGDNAISNASYIRLKNIYLSYAFPSNTLQKLTLTQLKLFVQAQNLFTITSYQGLDPEPQYASVLPPLRMITGGFQITF